MWVANRAHGVLMVLRGNAISLLSSSVGPFVVQTSPGRGGGREESGRVVLSCNGAQI